MQASKLNSDKWQVSTQNKHYLAQQKNPCGSWWQSSCMRVSITLLKG